MTYWVPLGSVTVCPLLTGQAKTGRLVDGPMGADVLLLIETVLDDALLGNTLLDGMLLDTLVDKKLLNNMLPEDVLLLEAALELTALDVGALDAELLDIMPLEVTLLGEIALLEGLLLEAMLLDVWTPVEDALLMIVLVGDVILLDIALDVGRIEMGELDEVMPGNNEKVASIELLCTVLVVAIVIPMLDVAGVGMPPTDVEDIITMVELEGSQVPNIGSQLPGPQ